MFVFPQRLGKMSFFFCSGFASSERPQLREVGDPHLLCLSSPELPLPAAVMLHREMQTYLRPACGSRHWDMHKSETLWRLARRYVLPGKSRTHVSPGLLVICVPGQGTQKSPSDSFAETGAGIVRTVAAHCSFLHGNRARAEPMAMPKPLWRHLYQQAKVQ